MDTYIQPTYLHADTPQRILYTKESSIGTDGGAGAKYWSSLNSQDTTL